MYGVMDLLVREFRPSDESDWLRCRLLAFLNTSYFDDVFTAKPAYQAPSIELTAFSGPDLVGLLDVTVNGDTATIETIAVLPESSRSGTGSALLAEAIRKLPLSVGVLDAWTREDAAANAWYLKHGFTEEFQYLHVFASDGVEAKRAVTASRTGLVPIAGFFHAHRDEEEQLRKDFQRVHVCRQYALDIRDERS